MTFAVLYALAILTGTFALLTILEWFAPHVGEGVLPDPLDEWEERP